MSWQPENGRSTRAGYFPDRKEWVAEWYLTPSSQTDVVEIVLAKQVLITLPMMKSIFPDSDDQHLKAIADELNSDLKKYKLDTKLRLTHFFAQVREETGSSARIVENFNYSVTALRSIFSYFRRNPEEAVMYGRSQDHPADPQAIANRAYAGRNGNGDLASGDGWKYQGRGLKQLTGRGNYQDFQDAYGTYWNDSPDFISSPELLAEPKHATRSAVFFWLKHGLYAIADQGSEREQVDAITKIINKYTDSYNARWQHFELIWSAGTFDEFSDD
ncbi:glycoside hydrolase family 19 protein [Lysobacter sp. F6437]|uniref:glycoside hydrolase family 19 protein n=1 Tax=Lysobacter sp. F6437 TaxID=3459296 RepID=UPI00403DE853